MFPLPAFLERLFALAKTLTIWSSDLERLNNERRAKIATYLDHVAETHRRAWEALEFLANTKADAQARRRAEIELSRISGYLDTICDVLDGRLDGRKVGGIRKRLERFALNTETEFIHWQAAVARRHRLNRAEGYFRALADSLRT